MATTTGATASVDSDRPPPLPLDSIPIIDLSVLSQSELFSLSMCSNSSFDLNRCDDVVIPKIDRSAFNESAGSRKQTYLRLRLAPAQSPTSTETTIHRRTPRLRSSHTPTSNNINVAEQAENSQIIRMLKELLKSDHNFEDLVPIEVEKDTNVVVPESLTPETNRKRRRPRSNEKAVFMHPPAAKRMCDNTVKKVVAYDADGDIENVNSRGVKVDLENLGRLEDPYGLEIRRRTEGMSTKDELLGFLGGLDGEWGTNTKKKRVVDASNFGDALPKGWRLSLSIKKKLGRVWLFCRRYISPSGRQFESCKEASMYLLSLVGEENLDKPTHTQSNNCDDFASKGASVNADICVQEAVTRKRPVVLALSTSLPRNCKKKVKSALSTSLPRNYKKKVKSNIVDSMDVQEKEVFKCLKCFMIFEGKVDLLDHQVLAHKTETSKHGTEISEWMVVKGGIFECQLCNTTFNESNQYNKHIGTHGTIDKKTSEASEVSTAEKTVVMESHDAPCGDKLASSSQSDVKISCGTESEINEHVHDLKILAHGNQGEPVHMNEDVLVEKSGEIEKKCNVDDKKTSEASEAPAAENTVVMEGQDETFRDKLVSSSSQSDDMIICGTESETNEHVHDLNIQSHDNQGEPVNMNEDVLVEESGGEIEMKCNVDDKKTSEAPTAEKTVVMESHDAPFGDKLESSSQGDDKISFKTESEINEHVHDLNIVAHGNQGEPVNMNEDVLVEESGGEIEKKCNVDDIEFPKIDKDPNVSVSKSDFCLDHEASVSVNESNGKFETSVGTVDCAIVEKDIAGMSSGQDAVSETGVTHVDEKLECILEKEKSSENTPVLPSTNELLVSVEKNVVDESVSDEVPNLADSETRVHSLKICEEKGFWENINDAHICSSFDDLASEKEKVMNENCVVEMKKKLPVSETESLSLVSPSRIPSIKQESPQKVGFIASVDDVTHDFEETRFSYGVDGQHEVKSSVIESYNMSNKECVNDDVGNKVEEPQTQMKMEDFDIKNDENNASLNRSMEVNLDDFQLFRNDESVNNEDTTGVMGLEFCSLVPPGTVNEQEFSFQDADVSGLYESGERGFLDHFSIPETYDDIFDEDRGIGIHELSLAFGNEQKKDGSKIELDTFDVQTDLSMVNNSSSNNNGNIVYPDTTWEDQFRSSGSNQQQNGNGVFRVDEQQRYNDGYSLNGFRSGRSEPVEFSFLTGRSEVGSSGGFPYNNAGGGMEQGFGSGFWSGKNGRNVITGVCAWCRNEFHILPETQGGVGSLCPSCSAGMSGQVNML